MNARFAWTRRAALVLPLAAPRIARAQGVYVFDQRQGTLEFTARHMNMFSSTGAFRRFDARLELDPDRTDRARVTVEIETGSASLAYPGANDLLRSSAYFDSARHPRARFTGRAAAAGSAERFTIAGDLEIRGIAKPIAMEARLVSRAMDPALGAEVAAFTAAGDLRRSDYGMTADQQMISDVIRLTVSVQLILGAPRGG